MTRVRRIDYSTLRSPTRRADGTLVADALITRTGVFSYRNPDGSERREYRPPQQVFDAKSIESFRLVPITDDHPPMMINAGNAKQYAVGAVGENVRQDGKYIAATIAVHDATTIAKMDAGKTAVSCGYDCELVETAGTTPEGERYDAVQTNIVGNHLAIVDSARAGAAAAVRMDAAAMCGPEDPATVTTTSTPKPIGRKDSDMTLEEAIAKADKRKKEREEQRARADAAETKVKELEADKAALQGKLDSSEQGVKQAQKERQDAVDGIAPLVKARVALLTNATAVLGQSVKRADGAEVALDALGDRELKLAVIKQVENVDCDLDAGGKKRPDVYVDARYDSAIERAAKSAATFQGAMQVIQGNRMDASGGDPLAKARAETAKARQDMIDRNRNGWMTSDQTAASQGK